MSGNKTPIVLFLNHWAKRLGGAEHSLLDILYFASNDFKCHLATSEPGPLIEKASQKNIECHVEPCAASLENVRRWNFLYTLLFSWQDILAFFVYVFRLRRLVLQIKPNLIHANIPKSHIALLILSRIGYRGKCCFHMREIFRKKSLPMFIYKTFFPHKNGSIIAISNAVKKNLPSSLHDKATVIYNGVSISPSPKEYPNKNILKLLYLGRIVPWKGCHLLIDILSMVLKKHPSKPIELSLVGDTLYWSNDYRNELKEKIEKLPIPSCCHLRPHTNDPDSVFIAHDIFCNASLHEPFGRVVAEAQGSGLPVVAFNTGGIPEIVEHKESGILVPEGDLKSFTDAIGRFIEKPDLVEKMGLKGRKRVECFFNRNKQMPIISNFLHRQIFSEQDNNNNNDNYYNNTDNRQNN